MSLAKDLLRLQTDLALTAGEVTLSRLTRRRLLRRIPRGDAAPVLLVPGYMAGDDSLAWLRDILCEAGFDAHTWGLGRNTGFREQPGAEHVAAIAERIIARVRALSAPGGRKVALVGQSLGGLYSRETAHRYPEEIDRVITLGSPTIHPYISDDQNSFIVRVASRKASTGARFSITGKQGYLHWGARLPALPMVAIWSPIDAVVFSQSARIPDYIVQESAAPAIRENLRLVCSHSGMAFNEAVVLAVADRLAEPVGQWQNFDARRYFPRWAIDMVENAFGNRLFHEFLSADWRREFRALRPDPREGDERESPLLRRLRRDHNDFHQLYAVIEDSQHGGGFGEAADYLLLADVARFMTHYLDRCHHPLEEFICERMSVIHPPSRSVLQRLAAEHERLAREGAALSRLVEYASDPRNPRDPGRLLARWRSFCLSLRAHIATEEELLFPLALEHISEAAWQRLERDWQRRHPDTANPLSAGGADDEFRRLFEYLSYIASRDKQPRGVGDNRLLGNTLDTVVSLSETVDRLLERRRA